MVEGGCLKSSRTERFRGFESLCLKGLSSSILLDRETSRSTPLIGVFYLERMRVYHAPPTPRLDSKYLESSSGQPKTKKPNKSPLLLRRFFPRN